MQVVGRFEKISVEQYEMDTGLQGDVLKNEYDEIKIPTRATVGSCGYDFFASQDMEIQPGETIIVRTGIRCFIENGWWLMVCPRGGLGLKFRLQLDNTIGVIDADYYGAKNEGHILIKLTNDGHEGKTCHIKKGAGLAQGIFVPFGIVDGDNVSAERVGGFGSTTK